MTRIVVSIMTALIVIGLACGDEDVTAPDDPIGEPVFMRLSVVDTSGNPVPNIRISAYTPFEGMPSGRSSLPIRIPSIQSDPVEVYQNYPNPTDGLTTIYFDLQGGGDWQVDLRDYGGTPIDSFSGTHTGGDYEVTWDCSDATGRLFSYRVTVTTVDTTFTSAPRYIVRCPVDYNRSILGFTNSGGVFDCNDLTVFPSLLDLPPLVHTNVDGDSLGPLVFLDTAVFTLFDTATGRHEAQRVPVTEGMHLLELVWDPQ